MNHADLKAYILGDTELAALAGVADGGNYPNSKDENIARAINGRMEPASKKVPAQDAFLYLLKRLKWRGIKAAATNTSHPATDAAFTAVELMTAATIPVDFLDAVSESLLAGMVSGGLIEPVDKTYLQDLSTASMSVAEKRFGQLLHNLDVARAFGRFGMGA